MSKKKSAELIPKIIAARNEEEAIKILNETLEALYISSDYLEMMTLEDKLKEFEKEYRNISDTYRSLSVPRSYEDLHNIRIELGFLYRDCSDNLSFFVNSRKTYWEDQKTVQRAESMKDLIDDKVAQESFKAKSASALREIVGIHQGYKEYVSCYSIAYGLFKNLETLLTSIRMMIDAIASEEKRELVILNRDVK